MTEYESMAMQILGLDPSSSKEMLQSRYAELVKQHKPEDDPEGFQKIHDAYLVLKRMYAGQTKDALRTGKSPGAASGDTNAAEAESDGTASQKRNATEKPEKTAAEKQDVPPESVREAAQPAEDTFDFGDILNDGARRTEQEQLHRAMILLAAYFSLNRNPGSAKALRDFMEQPEIRCVSEKKPFIVQLTQLVSEHSLEEDACGYLEDYYHLKTVIPNALIPEKKLLLAVLEARRRIISSAKAAELVENYLQDPAHRQHLKAFTLFFESDAVAPYACEGIFLKWFCAFLGKTKLKKPFLRYLCAFYDRKAEQAADRTALVEIRSLLVRQINANAGWKWPHIILIFILFTSCVTPVLSNAVSLFGAAMGSFSFVWLVSAAISAGLTALMAKMYRVLYREHSALGARLICALMLLAVLEVMARIIIAAAGNAGDVRLWAYLAEYYVIFYMIIVSCAMGFGALYRRSERKKNVLL